LTGRYKLSNIFFPCIPEKPRFSAEKNDLAYLSHILNSIGGIEEYTEGMKKKIFYPATWSRMGRSGKSRS
jgi:hypothetical protein